MLCLGVPVLLDCREPEASDDRAGTGQQEAGDEVGGGPGGRWIEAGGEGGGNAGEPAVVAGNAP